MHVKRQTVISNLAAGSLVGWEGLGIWRAGKEVSSNSVEGISILMMQM